tara:strand:+ start:7097 stop:7852 length:756 start_codon:yes stop_codon:yes gene_type:complete
MKYDNFFWLHIKKSAGISTRKLLQPYYKQVDRRTQKPKNFIQSTPEEYNDILNNFRVVLGEYQYKRVLFAKNYLYPNNWNSIFSFAFSRNPMDRCISMFYYLHYRERSLLQNLYKAAKNIKTNKIIGLSVSYDFDLFLELIERVAHNEFESIYSPTGLHFSTHTAPMFNDVTDMEGSLLLKKVYRLEHLYEGIEQVFEMCGLDYDVSKNKNVNKNVNKRRGFYKPNESQRTKIAELYKQDFELYENAANNI